MLLRLKQLSYAKFKVVPKHVRAVLKEVIFLGIISCMAWIFGADTFDTFTLCAVRVGLAGHGYYGRRVGTPGMRPQDQHERPTPLWLTRSRDMSP